MWDALVKIAIAGMNSGQTGMLFTIIVILLGAWMVDRYFLVRDLRKQNDTMIEAFQANTKAITELSTLINQLCQRV